MKRKSLALLMAAITVFSAVGCGSKDAAADTTTAEPAAEETPRHLMMQQQLTLHLMQMASMLEKR